MCREVGLGSPSLPDVSPVVWRESRAAGVSRSGTESTEDLLSVDRHPPAGSKYILNAGAVSSG